ncbi:MAG: tetratricopeptide repeat-containing sensor histidine kinase [Ignavibacteria bacterium]|nr:tetratricopeptide repeat-containing sensor histidine kinase [Ignavibacteria bacterium]
MDKKTEQILAKGQKIRESSPSDALKYFEKSLNLAKAQNDLQAEIEILFDIAVAKHNLSLHREAASIFRDLLSWKYQYKDLFMKANILRCLAVQYIRNNDIEEAIKYLYESEKVSKECGYEENLHMVESTLGSIYIQLKMFNKALEHEMKSLEIALKMNNEQMINYSYLGIGSCHYLLGDLDNAENYLLRSLNGDQTKYSQANTYYYLSKVYFDKKNIEQSENYAKLGYKLSVENNINDYKALCLGLTGTIFLEYGENEKAINSIQEAISFSESFENKRIYFSLYKDLIKAYDITGNYKAKSEAYEKLYNYHTEYLENQSKLKIKQLNSEYHIEKANNLAEIERLKNVELRNALENVKKLNAELEVLNREKNEFMAIAVHDLKNPIQNILSTARLIKRNSGLNEELVSLSENIVQQTDRMFNLIRKLLDHNAAEEGRIKINKSEFKAESICRDVMNDYKEAAERKQLKLKFTNFCNGHTLKTDYEILYQILCNLVSNAIKFSPKNRNIYLSLNAENGSFLYEIKDEGPGFSDDDKNRLFRKFSKLSAQPTMGESSTGLGLAIAKKLSGLINADLNLESNHGKGAKFTIHISEN